MPPVTVDQNILQQGKCVDSIQNKAFIFYTSDLFTFKFDHIDFSSWELKSNSWYYVQTGDSNLVHIL